MTVPGIDRVLIASLHQAIGDVIPDRLEFYENWLDSEGMRHGTIGLAALNAVLSFLRLEGPTYGTVVDLVGRYAAEWTVTSQARGRRALLALAPRSMRARAALRLARRTIDASNRGGRARVRMRNGVGVLKVPNSLFCSVRHSAELPLCGFYASLVSRLLELHGAAMEVRIGRCRAVAGDACLIEFQGNRTAGGGGQAAPRFDSPA